MISYEHYDTMRQRLICCQSCQKFFRKPHAHFIVVIRCDFSAPYARGVRLSDIMQQRRPQKCLCVVALRAYFCRLIDHHTGMLPCISFRMMNRRLWGMLKRRKHGKRIRRKLAACAQLFKMGRRLHVCKQMTVDFVKLSFWIQECITALYSGRATLFSRYAADFPFSAPHPPVA